MSRNLCQTNCYFCDSELQLEGNPHIITRKEAGIYKDGFQNLIVDNADCPICEAKYLAWMNRGMNRASYQEGVIADLSFRHAFNDEPALEDLPKYYIKWIPKKELFDVTKDYAYLLNIKKKKRP